MCCYCTKYQYQWGWIWHVDVLLDTIHNISQVLVIDGRDMQ